MIVPLILTIVYLAAQTILIVLALLSPSRPSISSRAPQPRASLRRGGVSGRLRIGDRGRSVRFLTFLPRGEM